MLCATDHGPAASSKSSVAELVATQSVFIHEVSVVTRGPAVGPMFGALSSILIGTLTGPVAPVSLTLTVIVVLLNCDSVGMLRVAPSGKLMPVFVELTVTVAAVSTVQPVLLTSSVSVPVSPLSMVLSLSQFDTSSVIEASASSRSAPPNVLSVTPMRSCE